MASDYDGTLASHGKVGEAVFAALEDRPGFGEALLPLLSESRARPGRPHWIVTDEAHHLLPEGRAPTRLLRRDYSTWFARCVKDEALAQVAARVEQHEGLSPDESRSAVRQAIEERYTVPP